MEQITNDEDYFKALTVGHNDKRGRLQLFIDKPSECNVHESKKGKHKKQTEEGTR